LRVETAAGDPKEYPLYAGKPVKEIGVFGKIGLAAKTLLAKPDRSTNDSSGDTATAK